ncbi:MAG TPA: histidinol-phosphate transaminase [Deltaproteobacteria bacterium]|jgi:histidinol-phosphate aminotransferase|nr:histidinol-phosphate transaminase [Deltaproteobacteria bacterium]HIJ76035.1 histidinol-phosphate transaminase [Deltaproteobacteria bacterium]
MTNAVPLEKLVPDYIKSFEAYTPSKPDDVLKKLYGCSKLYRLNNNENPLGPPEAARRAIRAFPPAQASIYPSGDAYHLRCKLADMFGTHPDQFLVGNGANEVIAFVIKAFCRQGDNIITADKTFAVYEWVAQFSGIETRLVPLVDYGFDPEGMIEKIDERTKLLFVCNPNNPTGNWWSQRTLRTFLDRIDGQSIVVVDEAYREFVESADFPDSMALIGNYPNLVVFRTFSKMYGLAGLRIGYLAGSREVVDIVRRTCVVYSVNALAQVGAFSALDDKEHIPRTCESVRAGKRFLLKELDLMGLPFVHGEGNFVMARLPMNDSLAYRKMMTRGVMVRSMTGFRFPNWIRITISHQEALEAFAEALHGILRERGEF